MVLLASHFPSAKPQNIRLFSPSPVPWIQAVNGSHIFIFIFFYNDPVCNRYSLGLDISANKLSKIPIAIPSHEWKNLRCRGELTQGHRDILKQLGLESCVVVPSTINFPTIFSCLPRGSTPSPRSRGAANRSYPTFEVRGGGRERQAAMMQERLRGAKPHPRPGVVAGSYTTSKERWLRCAGGLRGATPRSR